MKIVTITIAGGSQIIFHVDDALFGALDQYRPGQMYNIGTVNDDWRRITRVRIADIPDGAPSQKISPAPAATGTEDAANAMSK